MIGIWRRTGSVGHFFKDGGVAWARIFTARGLRATAVCGRLVRVGTETVRVVARCVDCNRKVTG